MRRIGIAGLAGALAMAFMSYVPVMGWLNLLLGLWYFLGGLVAAGAWLHQNQGRRAVLPCVAAALLAGTLVATGSGLVTYAWWQGVAAEMGRAEFLQKYPQGELTTAQIFDFWEGFGEALGAEGERELASLSEAGKSSSAEAFELRRNLAKLEEMKIKMARIRADHEAEAARGGEDPIGWMAQASHRFLGSLRDGDTSTLVWPMGLLLLVRGLMIVTVAMGGGVLGALVLGRDPGEGPEAPSPEPGS